MRNKWLFVFIAALSLLGGCSNTSKIRLDIFYAKSCGSCQALEENLLEKLAISDYEIVMHDIDEEESIALYQTIIDELEDPGISLKSNLSVPLIVYRYKFAMVGYAPEMDDTIIDLIELANRDEMDQIELPSGTWKFKEEK